MSTNLLTERELDRAKNRVSMLVRQGYDTPLTFVQLDSHKSINGYTSYLYKVLVTNKVLGTDYDGIYDITRDLAKVCGYRFNMERGGLWSGPGFDYNSVGQELSIRLFVGNSRALTVELL